MNHPHSTRARPGSSAGTPLGRAVLTGAGAGVVASLVMAAYAMGASLLKDTGFFTPLHHIASLLAPPASMMGSMEAAMAGNAFTIEPGPALLGAAIHMMTGAMYGAGLGLLVGLLGARLRHTVALAAVIGLVYGLVVFVLSAFVGLPLAAAATGAGEPIANMAQMAGWGTFLVEHLLFGLVLGLLLHAGLRRNATPTH